MTNNRKRWLTSAALLCVLLANVWSISRAQVAKPQARPGKTRIVQSFDADWRFNKGEAGGAEQPQFNDHAWRSLDVPHDWSIEGPFDKDNPTRGSGGFLPAGV